MAQERATGANSVFLFQWESAYGTAPAGDFIKIPLYSSGLSEEQALEEDEELGLGRDAQDPALGAYSDEGSLVAALDDAYVGYLLRAVLGNATETSIAATGTISFSANPSDTDTLTLNGTTWTFVSGTPSGNQTQIQGTVTATIDQLVTDLNASADTNIDDATYSRETGTQVLTVTHDTAGAGGNAYTLAASCSVATLSGATLTGGGVEHAWASGGADLPSFSFEDGNASMNQATYSLHTGVKLDGFSLDRARTGAARLTLPAVAQKETVSGTTIDATPLTISAARHKFQQAKGTIKSAGATLGNVVGASLNYANNLDRVETLDRDDGRISGADEGKAKASGEITVRFADRTLLDKAENNEAIDLEFGFTHPSGSYCTFTLPRVFLPKPKREVSGPGGIEATFGWQASGEGGSAMMTVKLLSPSVTDYAADPS